MTLTGLIIEIIKKGNIPLKRIRQWLRYRTVIYQAQWHGGQIIVGKNVKFNQKVIFQGKGKVILEDGVALGYEIGGSPTLPILIQPRDRNAVIEIGSGTALVNGIEIIAREHISIGKGCRIGARTVIIDADFHGVQPDQRSNSGAVLPVAIGNNVWVGLGVTILKGVAIGNDAVVGAGSIVTKDIPAGGIAVGNPMRIVGSVYDR